jgi:hypothetical protein
MQRANGIEVSEATDKLKKDLLILEAMAAEMDEYLRYDKLFWPLSDTTFPRLTLGGYLMRQHRLSSLPELLDEQEKARLEAAEEQFNAALVEKVVAFESRAHEELRARLRQWNEYLKELMRVEQAAGDYYASAVETRAMIAALLNKLETRPYKLDRRVLNEVGAYDRVLANYWEAGDFVWPEAWTAAYPRQKYWWLFGRPRGHSYDS